MTSINRDFMFVPYCEADSSQEGALNLQDVGTEPKGYHCHMSYSLSSLKGGYIGDYIEDHYGAY